MQPLERAKYNYNIEEAREILKNDEVWMNDDYVVQVFRDIPVPVFTDENGNPLLLTEISIRRADREPVKDWRDFQWIKNQIVGEENEGVELYPAESRLMDTSNQYYLWVFQDKRFRFPFGFGKRMVLEGESLLGEKQRDFPEGRKPNDLAECRAEATAMLSSLKASSKGK